MNSRINSLQIGLHWFPERAGGLDRVYHSLVQTLPQVGVQVRGLVAGGPAASAATNGTVRSFSEMDAGIVSRVMKSRAAVAAEFREHRPDLVAAHFAMYALGGLSAMRNVPFVMHFHGPWADESDAERSRGMNLQFKAWIEKQVYRRADKLIVLSHAFKDILITRYGIDPSRIEIVPGCVDVSHFNVKESRRAAREFLGLPQDRPIVFAVRRLVNRMGLEDLIDAVALLKQRQPDLLLVIAGRGKLAQALQARAENAGGIDSVRMLGYVPDDDLPLLYRAADLSVVPTVALEGFGLITIESLSAGTPVLVTPVGGLPEAVSGLSPDLVLRSTGAAAIADGIDDFLSGRRVMPTAEQCHAYARDNFDLPVIARQVAAVYQRTLNGDRAGRTSS